MADKTESVVLKRPNAFIKMLARIRINILLIYVAGGIVIYTLAHIFPQHSQEVFTAAMVWLAGGIGIAKDMTAPDPTPVVPAELLSESMELHRQALEIAGQRKK